LISVHGSRWDLVCEHKEWAPRRKIDAFGVDGNVMRDLVRQHLSRTHPTPPPTAKPDATTFLDTVKRAAAGRPTLKDGAKGTWVRDLQSGINAIVGRQVLTVDGQYGPTTGRWVRKFQQDHRLPSNGVVDTATWEALIAARLKKGT
jgi:peptidoglycan hydrolase-like protein with peptidoglycan-binding domain